MNPANTNMRASQAEPAPFAATHRNPQRTAQDQENKTRPLSEDAQRCLAIVAQNIEDRHRHCANEPLPLATSTGFQANALRQAATAAPAPRPHSLDEISNDLVMNHLLNLLMHRDAGRLARTSHHFRNAVRLHIPRSTALNALKGVMHDGSYLRGMERLSNAYFEYLQPIRDKKLQDLLTPAPVSWLTKAKRVLTREKPAAPSSVMWIDLDELLPSRDQSSGLQAVFDAKSEYCREKQHDWEIKVETLINEGFCEGQERHFRTCNGTTALLRDGHAADISLHEISNVLATYFPFSIQEVLDPFRDLSNQENQIKAQATLSSLRSSILSRAMAALIEKHGATKMPTA